MSTSSAPPKVKIYHEKQTRLHCAIHALNNLYQAHWSSSAQMDRIANQLTREAGLTGWKSPYRSVIPHLGQYDVMVIVEALKTKGAKLALHLLNHAKLEEDLAELKRLFIEKGKDVKGIILNRHSRNLLMRYLCNGRHWLALVPTQAKPNVWYDLDSKLAAPRVVGEVDQLLAYLRSSIVKEGGQAFLVVNNEDEKDEN